MDRPDPRSGIRLLSIRTLVGANYWTSFPLTRIDVSVGEYEEISSAEVTGMTEALAEALPGLVEHRCSIGERCGFLLRLRRGTYAPHIIEHVGVELQRMVGDDVGYGRARGGDREGEYTVVVEHRHGGLGAEAARMATEIVRLAFACEPLPMERMLERLRVIRREEDEPPPRAKYHCAILGSGDLEGVRRELSRLEVPDHSTITLRPKAVLCTGLRYASSETAIILDIDPEDVPPRYRETARRARIAAVPADAVPPYGVVVVPAKQWEVQELVREAGRRVAVYAGDEDVTRDDTRVAQGVARIRNGSILVECDGGETDVLPLRPGADPAHQAAAAMARRALEMTR